MTHPIGGEGQPYTITFREGLLGFSKAHRFTLLKTEAPGFFWLQSLDEESLAFLLVDPFDFFDDYSVELEPADVTALGASRLNDVAVFGIVTLPSEPEEDCTVNLLGPIVINLEEGIGRQVVLHDSPYGVRAILDLERPGGTAKAKSATAP